MKKAILHFLITLLSVGFNFIFIYFLAKAFNQPFIDAFVVATLVGFGSLSADKIMKDINNE